MSASASAFSPPVAALSINHVGVTVPDVFAAIDWYGAVFGMRCLMPPRLLEPAHHYEARSALGPRFKRAWQAHLLSGNGTGIELFQFIDPTVDDRDDAEPVRFTQRGPWHLCLTYPGVADLVAHVVAHGGTVLAHPVAFVPGREWVLAYVTDPWGTVVEIMSHSYAEVFGNWPQPGQRITPMFIDRPT